LLSFHGIFPLRLREAECLNPGKMFMPGNPPPDRDDSKKRKNGGVPRGVVKPY
jgi:hypothetical protein